MDGYHTPNLTSLTPKGRTLFTSPLVITLSHSADTLDCSLRHHNTELVDMLCPGQQMGS